MGKIDTEFVTLNTVSSLRCGAGREEIGETETEVFQGFERESISHHRYQATGGQFLQEISRKYQLCSDCYLRQETGMNHK